MKGRSETVARDADWLVHRYDPGFDSFHFRQVPRAMHREAVFLTDEYLGGTSQTEVVTRKVALAAGAARAPLHFIFHSAFCLSTLLARAFDIDGHAMGLKEPVVLNDISGWKRRGAAPDELRAVLADSLALLARPFGPTESVIIKPSNVVNALAPSMLELVPGSRTLLLYAPLEIYLRSVAKKGLSGRLWVRDLLTKLLRDDLIDLGFEEHDWLGLTDLQVAAVGWLAQQALFARMSGQFGPLRVRSLDSETLLADPVGAFDGLTKFFGLDLSPTELASVVAGPAFTRHSKSGGMFGSAARGAEYDQAAAAHRDELDKVHRWAEAVAANAGLSMAIPYPLLT